MELYSVLIVDDEKDFVDTTVKRLLKRQVKAVGVSSGETAIENLKETEFDVVVLDIKMPGGMDGLETLKRIKRIRPKTQVVLLTGHGEVESSKQGISLGAFDYMMKPVKLEALLEKINQGVSKKRLLS